MPSQPQLFPNSEPETRSTTHSLPPPFPPVDVLRESSRQNNDAIRAQAPAGAPVWLQRVSLFVLVLFCVYLGVLVMILPWWPRMWDQNLFLEARPQLSRVLHLGAVRGIISGLGALDIWIGISEAVHYRETR